MTGGPLRLRQRKQNRHVRRQQYPLDFTGCGHNVRAIRVRLKTHVPRRQVSARHSDKAFRELDGLHAHDLGDVLLENALDAVGQS